MQAETPAHTSEEPGRQTAGGLSVELEALPVPEGDRRWYLVRTKSRQEKVLADDLAARRYRHFLPLGVSVRHVGRQKLKSRVPLFPGYLFFYGTLEESFEVDRTDRVAQVMKIVDQDRFLRDLRPIHEAILLKAELKPYVPISLGEWVEVRTGPFRGLKGRVERSIRAGRLVLQVDLIGRAAVLEIDEALLDLVTV